MAKKMYARMPRAPAKAKKTKGQALRVKRAPAGMTRSPRKAARMDSGD